MRYETPESVEGVTSLLARGGPRGRVLAGGTDLLVQLRAGMIAPDLVVDIKRIRETREIREDDGVLVIGAADGGRAASAVHFESTGISKGIRNGASVPTACQYHFGRVGVLPSGLPVQRDHDNSLHQRAL